jgi:hypothetical protein
MQHRLLLVWARTFKYLWGPRIDSKEWIPPAYGAWWAGTITLFLYSVPSPHRLFKNSSSASQKSLHHCTVSLVCCIPVHGTKIAPHLLFICFSSRADQGRLPSPFTSLLLKKTSAHPVVFYLSASQSSVPATVFTSLLISRTSTQPSASQRSLHHQHYNTAVLSQAPSFI